MEIYVGHSSSIDYKSSLYQPLKDSKLYEEHNLVFPHEDSEGIFDSKTFLREECDLMIGEVSEPSTGLGIELGWADMYDVPVICIYQESADPSSSLSAVTDTVVSYEGEGELVEILSELVENV
ncbi:MAG: hypothetical protein ABEJ07_03895 [Candidatus Nanohaloarchaea archaeon]